MNELQSTIERGLQAQLVLDRPKPQVPTTVFSVYAPSDLVTAFKEVCHCQGQTHPVVLRRLIAEYIQDAQKETEEASVNGTTGEMTGVSVNNL